DGECQLAQVTANQYRSDLRRAGIGDGRHAFIIPLPAASPPGAPQMLHLRCAETGVDVPWLPITIERRPLTEAASQAVTSRGAAYLPASSADASPARLA